jgi:hypothetical protein
MGTTGTMTLEYAFSGVVAGASPASDWAIPPECPAVAECTAELDVVFVLDGSGSISPAAFETMRSFVDGMLAHYALGQDRVMVGVIQFSYGIFTPVTEIVLSADAVAIEVRARARRNQRSRSECGVACTHGASLACNACSLDPPM